MIINNWISDNYIEVFGAVTGIIYVFLEIRKTLWLWPVGIITSAVYIWVFFSSKFYADMSLQGYYLVISVLGWYWWIKGTGHRAQGAGHRAQGTGQKEEGCSQWTEGRLQNSGLVKEERRTLEVTRITLRTGIILSVVFLFLFVIMWVVLSNFTDSPVPVWDSFITSLSIVATWMLARKIYDHWFLWIVVNFVSAAIFMVKGLYPTVILYLVYGFMSFAGLVVWKSSVRNIIPAGNS